MLKLEHISIQLNNNTHQLHDVSFQFPDTGFISIVADDETIMLELARVLAGLQAPSTGTLQYDNTLLSDFNEEAFANYRKHYVSSLFNDFQILERRTVWDNVCLSTEQSAFDVDKWLIKYKLYKKKEMLMEELDFEDQLRVIMVRILLHQPKMLVVYPPSTPFSIDEWNKIYPMLQMLDHELLVIVVQDHHSFLYSDRTIEIQDGYVISDSRGNPERNIVSKEIKKIKLDKPHKKKILSFLHQHFRFMFFLSKWFTVLGLILLSCAWFSTTLDVTNIQMSYLEANNLTAIALEKHATGESGMVYENKYEYMNENDLKVLKEELQGDVFASYAPVNSDIANTMVYGMSANDMHVVELNKLEQAGLTNILGRYPENQYEVAMTAEAINTLFTYIDINHLENYLGLTISWYGTPLTITGIISGDQPNLNLYLSMYGYKGEVNYPYDLYSSTIFVMEGFHENHSISQQQAFVPSSKRMIDTMTLRSYDVSNIYPIMSANAYYFYDGKQLLLDNDGYNQSMIKEDEVILDFSMALKLGYSSHYVNGYQNDHIPWSQREEDYCEFIKNWIGKEIQVQAYKIDTAPDDSTIMLKTVTIKGFLFPVSWDYDEEYLKNGGSVLINKNAVSECMQPNTSIQEVYFHTENQEQMLHTLQYLENHPTYSSYFTNSLLLQFFVIDIKKVGPILYICGIIAFIIAISVTLRLLFQVIKEEKKEMSLYYVQGEQMSTLKKFHIQQMLSHLMKSALIACACSMLIIGIFIQIIYYRLSADASILFSILLPVIVTILFILAIGVLLKIIVQKNNVVEDLFIAKDE